MKNLLLSMKLEFPKALNHNLFHNSTLLWLMLRLYLITFNEIFVFLARGFWKNPGELLWSSVVFVVRCRSLFVVRCCRNATLSPHDFSERLKIWNFGNNKKVAPWCVDVQEKKKNEKKLFFWNFLYCCTSTNQDKTFLFLPNFHIFSRSEKSWGDKIALRQRTTTNDNEDNEWQRTTTNDNKRQRTTTTTNNKHHKRS